MSKTKRKLEQSDNGEDQNSQIEDEMIEELHKADKLEEELGVMELQKALRNVRNDKGDVWTAHYLREQFPTLTHLLKFHL